MLRLIEFPLQLIRLDDHKIDIFGMFQELFVTVIRTMRLGQNLMVLLKEKRVPIIARCMAGNLGKRSLDWEQKAMKPRLHFYSSRASRLFVK